MTEDLPTSWAMTTLGDVSVPRGLRLKPSEMKAPPQSAFNTLNRIP